MTPAPLTAIAAIEKAKAAADEFFHKGIVIPPQSPYDCFVAGFTAALSDEQTKAGEVKTAALADEKTDAPVANRPEWIWYCENTSGIPEVTFGRWPKYPQQARYKLADIQPTEHDHPTPVTQEQARNEIARRQEAGTDPRVPIVPHANVANLTGEQLQQIAYPSPSSRDELRSALVDVPAVEPEKLERLTRPIIGIENRTALEAFDIMADRIRSALSPRTVSTSEEQGEGSAIISIGMGDGA